MNRPFRRRPFLLASVSLLAGTALRPSWGQESATNGELAKTIEKGVEFLINQGQAADGSFTKQIGLGVTALATIALLSHGRTVDDPAVKSALKVLEAGVQENGGIYAPKSRLMTYETCIVVLAFKAANKDGRYDATLKGADKFLRTIPFDQNEDKANVRFGGTGYGGPGRPDLSNTAFFVEALRGLGAGADDQAIQNAMTFISRCQNLESEFNNTEYANKINDGGFYYSPVSNDDTEPNGGLASYGAMSYSGLKSMVYAGLSKDDPRVKAVLKWIGKNYTVSKNPGRGDNGLYYYYLTFAKGLDAAGITEIEDEKGQKHNWRADLAAELAKRQKPDGSWVNSNSQYMEGDANLCTSFALIALSYCQEPKNK